MFRLEVKALRDCVCVVCVWVCVCACVGLYVFLQGQQNCAATVNQMGNFSEICSYYRHGHDSKVVFASLTSICV